MRIGLGTVQFGLDYGVSNPHGITPATEVKDILTLAWENGIAILDTAVSYGMSEEVVGRSIPGGMSFEIVTKTPIFKRDRIDKADAARLKETFLQSLKRMRQSAIYGLLVHHANDLLVPGGPYLWEAMEALKEAGLVKKIGVSVYSPREIEELSEKYRLDLTQLPVNVFDQRMIQGGHLRYLKDLGIEIHSRSAFLQGLLLMPREKLPAHFASIVPNMIQYSVALQIHGISPLTAALAFVYEQQEIDHVLLGVNNCDQLRNIIDAASNLHGLDHIDFSDYAIIDESIINPSLWSVS